MLIIKSEKRICPCCMDEHDVKTVQVQDSATFKKRKVTYEAYYMYCDIAEELFMEGNQISDNDISMKDAYRKAEGLLTTEEIRSIRIKYGITQSDLCTLLGWGGKTITRYESHQVQDKAHDMILKKIGTDPEWFMILLKDAKDNLNEEAYQKYFTSANALIQTNSRKKLLVVRTPRNNTEEHFRYARDDSYDAGYVSGSAHARNEDIKKLADYFKIQTPALSHARAVKMAEGILRS